MRTEAKLWFWGLKDIIYWYIVMLMQLSVEVLPEVLVVAHF